MQHAATAKFSKHWLDADPQRRSGDLDETLMRRGIYAHQDLSTDGALEAYNADLGTLTGGGGGDDGCD